AKDLVGCDDVACTAEIALALDADYLLQGAAGRVSGKTYLVLKLIDAHASEVARRVAVTVEDGEALPETLERLVTWLLLDVESGVKPWVARLAYGGLDCSDPERCLSQVRSQLADIEFVVQQRGALLERYGAPLRARAVSLRLQERSLVERERARRNAQLTQLHEVQAGRVTQRWVTIHREPPAR
ncbi:MAG: hypothetical protein AAF658_08105, partial [Myxococcota bacterium]